MPVAVHRDLDRAVPKMRLDRLGVSTLGDEQRRAGVPQIVKADLLRQARASQRWAEQPAVEVVMPERPAPRGSKHERVTVTRPAGQIVGQLAAEKPRQADGALCVGLAPMGPPRRSTCSSKR